MKPFINEDAQIILRRTRRKRWLLALAALMLVALAAFFFHPEHEPIRRIPLRDGTELRLEYVTYGTEHRIPGAGRLRGWLSEFTERWPRLNMPSVVSEYSTETVVPAPVLWFTRFDPRTQKFLPDVDATVMHMEVVAAAELDGPFVSDTSNREPMPNACFPILRYDRRQPSIRLRLRVPEQIEFDIPNPIAGAKFPEWKPEPLPQARRIGAVDLTLESVELLESSRSSSGRPSRGPSWSVRTGFSVRYRGEPMQSALWFDAHLLDPTGNYAENMSPVSLRESAWKVRSQVRRTGGYPFAPNEGLTLGPIPMPGLGQYQVFPLPAGEVQRGFRLAVLFGPGRYLWRDSAFITPPPATPGEELSAIVEADTTTAMHVRVLKPTLLTLFGFTKTAYDGNKWEPTYLGSVVQLATGERRLGLDAQGDSEWLTPSAREAGRAWSFELPDGDEAIAPGSPVTIQIVPVETETVEFIFARPTVPDHSALLHILTSPPEPAEKPPGQSP